MIDMGKRYRGFSVLSLLLVVCLLVLLVSIALPMVNAFRVKSRVVMCANNLKVLGMAQHMHAFDFDGRMSYTTMLGGTRGVSHDEALAPYDGRNGPLREVWLERAGDGKDRISTGELDSLVWVCPLDDLNRREAFGSTARRSYAVNKGVSFEVRLQNPSTWMATRYTGVASNVGFGVSAGADGWSAKFDELMGPGETIIMMDFASEMNFQGWVAGTEGSVWDAVSSNRGYYRNGRDKPYPEFPSKFYAHESSAGGDPVPNSVFADGRVEAVSIGEELESVGSDYAESLTLHTRFDALKID